MRMMMMMKDGEDDGDDDDDDNDDGYKPETEKGLLQWQPVAHSRSELKKAKTKWTDLCLLTRKKQSK